MVVLRDARADDGPALTALVRTSSAYDGDYHVMVASLTVDAAYIAANIVRLAEDPAHSPGAGRVVGFYSLLLPGCGIAGEAELDYVFVVDDCQGRGVGRLLIVDVQACAARAGLRRVHVVAHPPAAGFYRAVGARDVGAVPPAGRVTWTRPHLVFEVNAESADRPGRGR